MKRTIWTAGAWALAMAVTAAACGGGDSNPSGPTGGGGGGTGGGGTTGTTITIGADGRVSPATLTVAVGSRVTFVNNHNVQHDMNSDPHPEHTTCPEINVGNLQPGQSRQTENLTVARTCGFHDHNQPSNTGLTGSIRIQ
jgi:plastocyanin